MSYVYFEVLERVPKKEKTVNTVYPLARAAFSLLIPYCLLELSVERDFLLLL